MIEIHQDKDNSYRFSLKTKSGHTLLNSVTFLSKSEVNKVIADLNTLLDEQSIFERKTDHSGKFLFNLKDRDGKIIGNSLLYGSEAGMENGIKNIKNRIASISKLGTL